MERSKLKLAVIFLLAVVNALLFGIVQLEAHQSRAYEQTGREQALVYLEKNGISADMAVIPWETRLTGERKAVAELLDAPEEIRSQADRWEVQTMRRPETLLVDMASALSAAGSPCTQITAIRERYRCDRAGDQAVITPVWLVETDCGAFCLDCASGSLSPAAD